MLMPEYFDGKEQRIMELYQQLSEFILKEAARFLVSAGKIPPTADRLLQRLRMMGETQAEIEKKLEVLTKLSRKELRALLQDAVLTSWETDEVPFREIGINLPDPLKNPAVIRIMDAQYKRSQGELYNLTRTTMRQSNIDLMNMLSEADMRVAAGVQSYSAAISDILDRYAHRGIYVDYPTGARRTLEAAVMCCVRTSMAQMAGQLTLEFVKESGTNLIITSAHTGARFTDKDEPANHMSWQGKVFYITDADLAEFTEVRYKIESSGERAGGSSNTGKYPDFRKTTGYGTGEGLDGYNCRHSFGPYDERIGNPWRDKDGNLIDGAGNRIDSEESKQKYKDSQRLRAIERNIRATKRQLVAKEELMKGATEEEIQRLQPEYNKLAYELAQQNKKYNEFAKEHNLTPQYGRTKLADFGREQTKQANAGAKRYQNNNSENAKENLVNNNASDTIKLSESEQHALNKYMSSESYVLNDKLRRGIKLSADEQEWAKSLDSALDKMPEYKGTVYRSVSDFGIENLDAFIKSHALDEAKVFSSYISTSKSVYDESFPIQYVIESKHGRDISALNSQEQEILFNRNSVFIVNKVEGNIIYMEEL